MSIDYARARREMPALKAALTRARKSGDPAKIRAACTKAVRAWEEWGAWPDNWATWQVALNDTEHWSRNTDLRDLL